MDASEATGRLERARFDTPVRSVGFYLGVKGKRTKHVVIAKEVIDAAKAYHCNVIPVGMIENVTVHGRDVLDPETKRVLKKFVHVSMTRLRGRDVVSLQLFAALRSILERTLTSSAKYNIYSVVTGCSATNSGRSISSRGSLQTSRKIDRISLVLITAFS